MGRDRAHKLDDAVPPEKLKGEKLKGKKYLAELKALHAELVSLQEWIRHQGLKVCIVFDGRDGAGNSAMRLNPAASRPSSSTRQHDAIHRDAPRVSRAAAFHSDSIRSRVSVTGAPFSSISMPLVALARCVRRSFDEPSSRGRSRMTPSALTVTS